ncbi:hypothetical protein M0R01_03615 [bacterium]|nr:hypothetical protein [bacterium]
MTEAKSRKEKSLGALGSIEIRIPLPDSLKFLIGKTECICGSIWDNREMRILKSNKCPKCLNYFKEDKENDSK